MESMNSISKVYDLENGDKDAYEVYREYGGVEYTKRPTNEDRNRRDIK